MCLFVLVLFVVGPERRNSSAALVLESDEDWAPSFNLMEQVDVGTFAGGSEETALAQFDENDDSEEDEGEDEAAPVSSDDKSDDDAVDILHPMVDGDGRKVKSEKPHKIVHVGAMPSNLDLLGISAQKPKKKIVGVSPGKAAAATFLPRFVKDNLMGDLKADAKANSKVDAKVGLKLTGATKKAKKHVTPPSALDTLMSASKKKEIKKMKKEHKAGKFGSVADVVANLKKRYVKKVHAKEAKLDAQAKHALHRLKHLREWLDLKEADPQGHMKSRVRRANKAAASWLLENDNKSRELSVPHLHELIHWHQVAREGGIQKEEITKMVDHANKKHLSQSVVVAQVTSANAKAAAFSALKEKTTPATDAKKRLEVADEAVEEVVSAAQVLDDKHQMKVIKVAKKKMAMLLDLQRSLERKVDSAFGLAAVKAGDFCVLKWYKEVLGAGCDSH